MNKNKRNLIIVLILIAVIFIASALIFLNNEPRIKRNKTYECENRLPVKGLKSNEIYKLNGVWEARFLGSKPVYSDYKIKEIKEKKALEMGLNEKGYNIPDTYKKPKYYEVILKETKQKDKDDKELKLDYNLHYLVIVNGKNNKEITVIHKNSLISKTCTLK